MGLRYGFPLPNYCPTNLQGAINSGSDHQIQGCHPRWTLDSRPSSDPAPPLQPSGTSGVAGLVAFSTPAFDGSSCGRPCCEMCFRGPWPNVMWNPAAMADAAASSFPWDGDVAEAMHELRRPLGLDNDTSANGADSMMKLSMESMELMAIAAMVATTDMQGRYSKTEDSMLLWPTATRAWPETMVAIQNFTGSCHYVLNHKYNGGCSNSMNVINLQASQPHS